MLRPIQESIGDLLVGIFIGIGVSLIPTCVQPTPVPQEKCNFNEALNASWAIAQKQDELDMQRIKYLGGPDNFLKWLNMRNERAVIDGDKE